MLTLWGNRHRFCDGISRRHFSRSARWAWPACAGRSAAPAGPVVSRFRSAVGDRLPHYVSMVPSNPNGQGLPERPHYLGAAHKPFCVAKGEALK
jgi:hypothetical protein